MSEFSAVVHDQDGARIIAVAGEFDLGGATEFREARTEALLEEGGVVIDLTECTFIDSTGIACVVRTFERADHSGRPFALVASAFHVRRVLELVGIPQRVPCFESLDEAVARMVPVES